MDESGSTPDAIPQRKPQARRVLKALIGLYPEVVCGLAFQNAFELLVATVLSAQCTDARVNQVTPILFDRFPDPASLARADLGEVERIIYSTGFYRAKANNLVQLAIALMADHAGLVPKNLAALVALPGVGRKTAHVVLGNAFAIASGVVVDTHVKRLTYRLGLTTQTNPVRIEHELGALIPKREWVNFSHRLITHGRGTCLALRPRCRACALAALCPQVGVTGGSRPNSTET